MAENSSQFSFTLFGSMYVFFKYTIDKKRRREGIDCCYLYKTIIFLLSQRGFEIKLRILCYHVNSTRYSILIDCSQPIRFFIIRLMFKSGGFPAPLVALNSMIKLVRFLKLRCNVCLVIPVNSQLVFFICRFPLYFDPNVYLHILVHFQRVHVYMCNCMTLWCYCKMREDCRCVAC